MKSMEGNSFNAKQLTSRAHKVLQIAHWRALASDKENVGSEHLLAGLLEEGSGFAVAIMVSLGVDVMEVRRHLAKVVPEADPDQLVSRRLPLAADTENTLQLSAQEAEKMGSDFVGTEHLLLGLLRCENALGGQILTRSGLALDGVRERLHELSVVTETEKPKETDADPRGVTDRNPAQTGLEGFTSRALEAIDKAREEAREAGRNHVGTDHLLLGVLSGEESAAVRTLKEFVGNLDELREQLRKLSRLL